MERALLVGNTWSELEAQIHAKLWSRLPGQAHQHRLDHRFRPRTHLDQRHLRAGAIDDLWGMDCADTSAVPPTATDDPRTTNYKTPITIDILTNDDEGDPNVPLDVTSVTLINPSTGQPATTVETDDGKWEVTSDGQVTFTPAPGFAGSTTIDYQVFDENGNPSNLAQITVTVGYPAAPTAADDTATTPYNNPVTFNPVTNDTKGDADVPFDPTSVTLVAGADSGKTITTADGLWEVDDTTGEVTFTPGPNFTGVITVPVDYIVVDKLDRQVQATITVTVGAPPRADDDSETTQQGVAVTLTPLANDATGTDGTPAGTSGTWNLSTFQLLGADGQPTSKVVVPGEGTWTVEASGTVQFVPQPTFTGTTSRVDYTVKDSFGNPVTASMTVLVTPVVPTAAMDSGSGAFGNPVTIDVLDNDSAGGSAIFDETSVRLLDPKDGNYKTTVVIADEGTWKVNSDGTVTFTPETGFTGTTSAIGYRVTNSNETPISSTVTATIGPGPQASPDNPVPGQSAGSGEQGRPVTVDVLVNDTPSPNADGTPGSWDTDTLQLIDPTTGQATGSVTVPGEGTWTVTDGHLVFIPLPTFTGTTSEVTYTVIDSNGNPVTTTATVHITEVRPVATPDAVTGPKGQPVTITVLGNDAAGSTSTRLVADTVRLVSPSGALVDTLTIDGEGTWTVNADGTLTFTPEADFTGTSKVTYQVADSNGTPTRSTASATISETSRPVDPPKPPVTDQPVTNPPKTTTTPTTTTPTTGKTSTSNKTTPTTASKLARTGSDTLPAAAAGLGSILAGLLLVTRRRRRGASRG